MEFHLLIFQISLADRFHHILNPMGTMAFFTNDLAMQCLYQNYRCLKNCSKDSWRPSLRKLKVNYLAVTFSRGLVTLVIQQLLGPKLDQCWSCSYFWHPSDSQKTLFSHLLNGQKNGRWKTCQSIFDKVKELNLKLSKYHYQNQNQ